MGMDYSSAERDLAGDPVPNGRGGFFDHIHEIKDSYNGLKKVKRSLERILENPNLGLYEKNKLTEALDTVNDHFYIIDNIFKPYGGIDKW